MSYQKPFIDEKGLHRPTYSELLEAMVDDAYRIFGNGIYLGHDSQDYQFIATMAEKIYDTHELLEAVYMSRSPLSATGIDLDAISAINGIRRKTATRSTVELRITGTPNGRIEGGIVADDDGHLWDLPDQVALSEAGEATVTAVCREYGTIYVPSGGITRIMTPMIHWISVTNDSPACVGSVTENDASLRSRRALSAAQPSRSIIDGIRGGIAALPDVERWIVLENDQKMTDTMGLPPHSICAVVEGGLDGDIARALYLKKAPGCYTHGDVSVDVQDGAGGSHVIRFMRPNYIDIRVKVHIRAREGLGVHTSGSIQGRIAGYVGELGIGGRLSPSVLWMVAQSVDEDAHHPTFAVEEVLVGRKDSGLSNQEIALSFREIARLNVSDIEIALATGG